MKKWFLSLALVAIMAASSSAEQIYVDIVWHVPSLPAAIRHSSIPLDVIVYESLKPTNRDTSGASLYLGSGYAYTYHTLDLPDQGYAAWGIDIRGGLHRRYGYDGKYYLVQVLRASKLHITPNHTEVIQIYIDAWIDPNQED